MPGPRVDDMIVALGVALIVTTWRLTAALVPVWLRMPAPWGELASLTFGTSGSIAALILVGSKTLFVVGLVGLALVGLDQACRRVADR